jgi:hypothetical protein
MAIKEESSGIFFGAFFIQAVLLSSSSFRFRRALVLQQFYSTFKDKVSL